ncbi:MAG: TolC family protein [Moraxellaceae bacterium]|nr:TolC family protein [Moraxellaceae bacterium]
MKKLAILLLCSPLASYAQTLPQAVQAALSFHPQIKAAEQQLLAQQANVNIKQAALKPHLILSGEVGRSSITNYCAVS